MLAPQGQRKRVPDLGSAEPEGTLVLSSGGRFQEVKNNAKTIKPSGQKLVAVAYERLSFTRGCNHRILTGKIFVFG